MQELSCPIRVLVAGWFPGCNRNRGSRIHHARDEQHCPGWYAARSKTPRSTDEAANR